jgi:hypothetical protein
MILIAMKNSMSRFTSGFALTAYFWFPEAAAAAQLGVRMGY